MLPPIAGCLRGVHGACLHVQFPCHSDPNLRSSMHWRISSCIVWAWCVVGYGSVPTPSSCLNFLPDLNNTSPSGRRAGYCLPSSHVHVTTDSALELSQKGYCQSLFVTCNPIRAAYPGAVHLAVRCASWMPAHVATLAGVSCSASTEESLPFI